MLPRQSAKRIWKFSGNLVQMPVNTLTVETVSFSADCVSEPFRRCNFMEKVSVF